MFHVTARSVAAQALSIFCDHGDVMATHATGFALLASNSVQEAMDIFLPLIKPPVSRPDSSAALFDGFRTSHEIARVEPVTPEMREG